MGDLRPPRWGGVWWAGVTQGSAPLHRGLSPFAALRRGSLGSIPDVAFVIRDGVLLQQSPVLVLERDLPMMLQLVGDVLGDDRFVAWADREDPVARLPVESVRGPRVNSLGCPGLDLPHQVSCGDGARQ